MEARNALAGMVKIHAQSRLMVTPQRTADILFTVPTPIIAPVRVWVVLTGILRNSVRKRVNAPAVSADTPSNMEIF